MSLLSVLPVIITQLLVQMLAVSPDDRVPVWDDLVALCVLVAAGDGARPAGEGVRAGAAQRVPAVTQQLGLQRVAVALGALEGETF